MADTIAKTPQPPYYAVIFSSLRPEGDNGYGATAARMEELARQQPEAVPARKVRAALASVRSVLDGARCRGQLPAPEPDTALAAEAGDQRLLRRLADFPDEVRAAARELDPSRITRYAVELAGLAAPVAAQAPEPARLALLDAAEVVLTNALQILGISTD